MFRLDLPKFTLVGATTRAGQLSAPLRDRFGVNLRLELYTPEELARIVTRSATILGMEIEPAGAMEIASRSRGTPRIANRLLKRVRDYAQVKGDGVINIEMAKKALEALVNENVLDSRLKAALILRVAFFGENSIRLGKIKADFFHGRNIVFNGELAVAGAAGIGVAVEIPVERLPAGRSNRMSA